MDSKDKNATELKHYTYIPKFLYFVGKQDNISFIHTLDTSNSIMKI